MSNVATLPAVERHGVALPVDVFAPAVFDHTQRIAKVFCASALVPEHLRKNIADVMIALAIAKEMRESPVVVMQNIFFIGGKAGWAAQYMIARANRSGTFKERIRWRKEGAGDALKVTAYARLADDSGELVEAEASMALAIAESWTRNPKYKTMPEHMLKWRSATMLIRLHCPEVMLGMPTEDELRDVAAVAGPGMRDITPAGPAAAVAAALADPDEGQTLDQSPGAPADTSGDSTPAQSGQSPEAGEGEQLETMEAPWDDDKVKAVARQIVGELLKLKAVEPIDKMVAARGAELFEIKRASETTYDTIMRQVAGKKTALGNPAA